ncbi:MAG: YfhO family protein, partial [Mollicutes bacterium]|nr:YfhO family protein [Mollicutes bacterium]
YKIKSIDLKHYLLFLSIFLIISNVIIINKYIFLNIWSVYLSVVIMIFYLMLLRFYHFASNKEKKLLSTLLIFLVLAEILFNFYFSIYKHEFESKDEYNISYTTIVDQINNIKPNDNEFYRIEKEIKCSYIDSLLMDYEGASVFLSTLNENAKKIMTNTGHTTLASSIYYNVGANPIMDSLLGIKYFISDDKIPSYKLIDEFQFSKFSGLLFNEYMDDFYVLENPNSLSLGFMVNDKVKDFINIFKEGKITNVFDVQNYMLKTMVDQDVNYLKPYSFTKINDSEFEVEINNTKDIYIVVPVLIDNPKIKVHMFINDELVWTYNSRYTGVFKILNTYENSTIKFKIKVSNATGNFSFVPSFYYLEEEEFLKAVEELKKNQMEIIKKDKNYLKGKIEVNEDKTVLFTSIPYEKGWEILVDGKKVEYFPIFDSFIGLDLDVGVHEIEFKFVSPLFKLGLIISIISALLFIFYIRFEEKIIKNITKLYFKYEEIISYLIVGGFITIVSIGSYAVFSRLFGLNYIISNILSFVVAVIVAFFTNKIFVFKTDFENIRKTIWEMYQFIKYRIITLGIDVILMIAFVEWLHINDLIAKIVVQIVVVIMNYFFSKLIVFKKVNN